MNWHTIIWDDGLGGNVEHIARNGVTPEEVEEVLSDPDSVTTVSNSSGYPITFGWTVSGRHVAVVWEEACDDPLMIYPVTAYEPTPEGE